MQTTTDDPDLSNNTSTVVVPVQATADLAVTKTAPPSVDAGALLTYTVTVENLGPDTAHVQGNEAEGGHCMRADA